MPKCSDFMIYFLEFWALFPLVSAPSAQQKDQESSRKILRLLSVPSSPHDVHGHMFTTKILEVFHAVLPVLVGLTKILLPAPPTIQERHQPQLGWAGGKEEYQ